jgi:hypothetical protein
MCKFCTNASDGGQMVYCKIYVLNPETQKAELWQAADADRLNVEVRRCRINNVRLKAFSAA